MAPSPTRVRPGWGFLLYLTSFAARCYRTNTSRFCTLQKS